MVDGDEDGSERDLPQYQSGMGSLFVGAIRFRHYDKERGNAPVSAAPSQLKTGENGLINEATSRAGFT